jgi:AraC-like DNA-binding protein
MGKVSMMDKMRMQTLHEQGLGAKAIIAAYPDKQWKLGTVKMICRRVDERGSALERRKGSGRPKSVRTPTNIDRVDELICSQESDIGKHLSTREISAQLNISRTSVRRMAKQDLNLTSFRRVPAQIITNAVRQKRLERSSALLRRLKVRDTKHVFFTDEKNFYLNPPICNQTNRVWSSGKKAEIGPDRLLVERQKFAPHVMVSAGVCFGGKSRLHFVDDKAKVDATYYVGRLLPELTADCKRLLPAGFIFQQDGAPAHTARLAQDWLRVNCPGFIEKDQWPPNSPDLNPLDYHVWGAMLDKYHKLQPKPNTIRDLKIALELIWEGLAQGPINKAIKSFTKRLRTCVDTDGGHIEHML